jgi:hypothetical protein
MRFEGGARLGIALVAALAVSCGGGQKDAAKDEAAAPPSHEQAPPSASPEPSEPATDTARATPPEPEPPRPSPTPSRPAPPVVEKPPAPAPAPPPAPPEPVIKTVPVGTTVPITFLDGVSSAASQVGDSFRSRVSRDVMFDGMAVIPAGSVITGTVTEAVSLKKIGGKAKLSLDFTRVDLPSGGTALVHASMTHLGKSETAKDAATIGGAAAGGAILGRVLSKNDRDKGTVLGALAGAAAGTVIAAKTAGQEIEIPAGTESTLTLDRSADITVQR